MKHTVRIAVWDTNSQFPRLRATLDRINNAQSYYGFEVVDLSVPLDAWHTHDGVRYLDADHFAKRLAPQIPQLEADYLCAIVDEWMVCDVDTKPVYDIYGWWPGRDKPPVLIFSTKDLGLEPKGPETDRAVANAIAGGIAGYLMTGNSHAKGPRDCPNYLNPNRELKVLTSPKKFCASCTRILEKEHADKLKALNAILREFD